ncbi:SGNH hydrolase-type esterase domain protein [Vibrio phage 1.184.A._10N.286.49.A5]|nr:SGNH hydrolase-type esterase domain protein [Vibrio phage 1.184.A._10N.286.49.A5]
MPEWNELTSGMTSQDLGNAVQGVHDSGLSKSGIAGSLQSASAIPTAAGRLVGKLEDDNGDCNIFVCSDSTGNEEFEWVYQYALTLAARYPAYTVNYYLWGQSEEEYLSPVELQAGTGIHTLNIWNGAISGSRISYLMGDKAVKAFRDIPDCDLVFINHGHNMISSYPQIDGEVGKLSMYLEAIADITSEHRRAGVIFLTQNPRRDTDDYKDIYRTIIMCAGLINADVADSYKVFQEAGKPLDWFKDSIHPSTTGVKAYTNEVLKLHNSTKHKACMDFMGEAKTNILENGTFAYFSGATPDYWVINAESTSTKETVIVDGINGYSVKLDVVGSGGAQIFKQTIDANRRNYLKGKHVVLAVRMYIPEGQADNLARPAILTNSNSVTYEPNDNQRNGWHWRIVTTKVLDDASYFDAAIYLSASSVIGTSFYVDRAILVTGLLPFDDYK